MERSALKTALRNWYREDLHNTVIWKASLETFSFPKNPFKIHPTVSSSSLSRVICNLRVGIDDMGNRIPPPDAARVTVCPLCRKKGRLMKLDVTHVIATCEEVAPKREETGMEDLLKETRTIRPRDKLRNLLNREIQSQNSLDKVARIAASLIAYWKSHVNAGTDYPQQS